MLKKNFKRSTRGRRQHTYSPISGCQGAVPNVYTRQTLQKVEQNLQQEADTLTKADLVRQYPDLPTQLQQLQQSVHLLSAAIAQGNRATVTQKVQQLSAQEQELYRLTNSLEAQP